MMASFKISIEFKMSFEILEDVGWLYSSSCSAVSIISFQYEHVHDFSKSFQFKNYI